MPHWKKHFDNAYLGAWDLIDPEGRKREMTCTIDRVEAGEITGENGRKDKKPVIYLVGRPKPIIANKTNCKVIAGMYGNETNEWIGKRITLYSASVSKPGTSGEMVDAIRIRPTIPPAAKASEDKTNAAS